LESGRFWLPDDQDFVVGWRPFYQLSHTRDFSCSLVPKRSTSSNPELNTSVCKFAYLRLFTLLTSTINH
jgi:hypothetical protein